MNDLLETFKHDRLTIEISESDRKVTVVWRGESDARDPSSLIGPFLEKVVDRVGEDGFVVDFRPAEFMNSATFAAIIHFLKSLASGTRRVVVHYDSNVWWQRVNFTCIEALSKQLPCVRMVGA